MESNQLCFTVISVFLTPESQTHKNVSFIKRDLIYVQMGFICRWEAVFTGDVQMPHLSEHFSSSTLS